MSILTQFKKFNRKYIIITSMDDSALPADSEILGEGVCVVYTPSGQLEDVTKARVGDGKTTFGALSWLGETEIEGTEDLRSEWYSQHSSLIECERMLKIPTEFTINGAGYTVDAGTLWADFCESADCPAYIEVTEMNEIRAYDFPILNPFGDAVSMLEPIGTYDYIIGWDKTVTTTLYIDFAYKEYYGYDYDRAEHLYGYTSATWEGKYSFNESDITYDTDGRLTFTGTPFNSANLTLQCKIGDTLYFCPGFYNAYGFGATDEQGCVVTKYNPIDTNDAWDLLDGFAITVTAPNPRCLIYEDSAE